MNSTEYVREYMAREYSNERFMIHVGEIIEQQLKEWDKDYRVNILKLKEYVFIVKNGEQDYWLEITEEQLANLQKLSPFALDKHIWFELQQQGLEVLFGYGNYLDKVLNRE